MMKFIFFLFVLGPFLMSAQKDSLSSDLDAAASEMLENATKIEGFEALRAYNIGKCMENQGFRTSGSEMLKNAKKIKGFGALRAGPW